MKSVYMYQKEMNNEDLIIKFNKELLNRKMYLEEYNKEGLIIDSRYIVYPIIEGKIKNLSYFYVKNEKQDNGVIDGEYTYIDPEFLINEFNVNDFVKSDKSIDEFKILNPDYKKSFNSFLDLFNKRLEIGICDRHNLIMTDKKNKLDISIMKYFDLLDKKYYLEQVYVFSYFDNKHLYKSIYSTLRNDFHVFDFVKNEKFKEYLKTYRKPVVKIPKEYLEQYYLISFKVYSDVIEELNYITLNDMYRKVKSNINYKKNIKYYDYLNKLIFYFKKPKYLFYYENIGESLKNKLFFYYLTLNYNNESGLELAKLIKLGIVEGDYVKMLTISSNLGNMEAKNKLLEYFSIPKNYNENMIKKYN